MAVNRAAFPITTAAMRQHNQVELKATFHDEAIRKQGINHDGFETIQAIIPNQDGQWRPVDLEWHNAHHTATYPGGFDEYKSTAQVSDSERGAMRERGIAFRAVLKDGTEIWAQEPNKNVPVQGA